MKHSAIRSCLYLLWLLSYIAIPFSLANAAPDDSHAVSQITVKIDGRLDEWSQVPILPLNKLKDEGFKLPAPEDSAGFAQIAWNEQEPNRLYFTFRIHDDTAQYTTSTPSNWWFNDSVEILVETLDGNLVQWAINASGELHSGATPENTEWKVIQTDDGYLFEVAIDLSGLNFSIPEAIEELGGLKVSVQYNDGEEDTRQHQLGWTAGATWNAANFGKLSFHSEAEQEPSGPLDNFSACRITTGGATISGEFDGERVRLFYAAGEDRGEGAEAWEHHVELDTGFSHRLEGLLPETHYSYRLSAEIDGVSVWSKAKSFNTYKEAALENQYFSLFTRGASWSLFDKRHGIVLEDIRPGLKIKELRAKIDKYPAKTRIKQDVQTKFGQADRVVTEFMKPDELLLRYEINLLQESPDVIVQTMLVNMSGKDVTIAKISPLLSDSLVFANNGAELAIAGDAKQYSDYYSLHQASSLKEPLNVFWYAAFQNKAANQALAIGNLSNNKGIGRYRVEKVNEHILSVNASNDYEKIFMPPDAMIIGEPLLLSFRRRGVEALEQLGTLIAKNYGINAASDHPIDLDDPASLDKFNFYSHYGSAVIDDYPSYSHNSAQHKRPYEDPAWVARQQDAAKALGFKDFGYFAEESVPEQHFMYAQPLVRNYGKPDFWFPAARQVYEKNSHLYIDEKADFSNPELLAIEQQRAEEAFSSGADTILYGFDFVNKWQKLPGQHDPFMTSAETFRAGLQAWRELAKQHPSPYTMGRAYMNIVGFLYDLADIVHIGADSDHGYHSGGCCSFIDGLTRQISGRWFYNGKVWWNNPDTFHVYAGGLYSYNMAKVHASYTAISGNISSLGEPFADQETPEDRLEIIRKVSPTTKDISIAVDMFEHNPARLWNMPVTRDFGNWNIVALFNLDENQENKDITQKIDFKDLGLSSETEYLVYEFWNQEFLGTIRGGFNRTLPPIDCEVYSIVEKLDRPQLISTSRHLRHMAYDVVDLRWDADTKTLSGISRLIANYPHELVVSVPEGYTYKTARAGELEVMTSLKENILRVKFTNVSTTKQEWKLAFE